MYKRQEPAHPIGRVELRGVNLALAKLTGYPGGFRDLRPGGEDAVEAAAPGALYARHVRELVVTVRHSASVLYNPCGIVLSDMQRIVLKILQYLCIRVPNCRALCSTKLSCTGNTLTVVLSEHNTRTVKDVRTVATPGIVPLQTLYYTCIPNNSPLPTQQTCSSGALLGAAAVCVQDSVFTVRGGAAQRSDWGAPWQEDSGVASSTLENVQVIDER